ncbi:MAG: CsgG/HfaB family protein [bacterium]|nr:CsgG/HfaB family protein [bacterium]
MKKYILFVLLISLLFFVPLYGQEKTSVAVLDFTTGSNVSPGLKSVLALQLSHDLVNSGKFRVLDRKNIDAILKEQGFSLQDCATDECIIQVGKLLNTQRMVTGNVSMMDLKEFGKLYAVTAMISNVGTHIIEAIGSTQCFCREDELIGVMEKIADDLTGRNGAKNKYSLIEGTLLFAGRPIPGVINQEIVVNLSEESSNEISVPPAEYDGKTSRYRIKNIKPARYRIDIGFDTRVENPLNAYRTCNGFKVFDLSQNTSNQDIDFICPIHLTKPIDNRIKTNINPHAHECSNTLDLKNPVVISWDPIGKPEDNVYYKVNITQQKCPTNSGKYIYQGTTQKTQLTFNLPPSTQNEYYSFSLKAFTLSGKEIGQLSVETAQGILSFKIK